MVVFDQGTGDTHHLGSVAGRILLALLNTRSPLAVADLTRGLYEDESAPLPALAIVVRDALQGLEGAGLVERDSS